MKLAIADPPYPPNLLAAGRATGHGAPFRATRYYAGGAPNAHRPRPAADDHPDAHEWNRPERHRALLEQLLDEYDGWAIATTPDAVAAVYPPLPYGIKVLCWVKPNAQPTGHRIRSTWEAVLLYAPLGRRGRSGAVRSIPDVLVAAAPGGGFAGAKPPQWTRWVLDALSYDQDADTVDDLFPGSGAVTAAISQAVLL